MPGDKIRLASLFFDTAPRTRKRKRNRRNKYPQKPYVRLLPDKWNTRVSYGGSLNRTRTQEYCYYFLLWSNRLHLLMPCVTSNARMVR